MKKFPSIAFALFIVLGLTSFFAFAGQGNEDETEGVDITISPKTFILSVDEGEWVTVHTDLPFSQVEAASIRLNGIPLVFAKSDNLGFFVAKLYREDVEATVAPPSAVLEFTGWTYNGDVFYATDVIRVKE